MREFYEREKDYVQALLNAVGTSVVKARESIERGDLEKLGYRMGFNHTLLGRLTVSSPELDALVTAAQVVRP